MAYLLYFLSELFKCYLNEQTEINNDYSVKLYINIVIYINLKRRRWIIKTKINIITSFSFNQKTLKSMVSN